MLLTVSIKGGRVYLASPFAFKDAAKSIPGGRWDKLAKSWHFPATAAVAEAIARAAKLHSATLDTDAAFDVLLESAREAFRARRNRTRTDLDDLPTKTSAWTHQRQAYWFSVGQPSAMLAMDMGTGKSLVAIALAEGWEATTMVVLCPTSVINVWTREFRKHSTRPWRVVAPRKGTVAKRTAEMAAVVESATTAAPVCIVINYEASWRDEFAKFALGRDWDVVVADESHRIKAPGGKAAKFAQQLGHHAAHRLALTGTPLAHGPLDLYSQFRFLDEGIFGTSFAKFRNRYAILGGYGGYEVKGYQRQDELAERMSRLAFQVKASDVLDLPGERDETRTVPLGPKSRRAYDDLYNDYFAEVGEGSVEVTNALTRLLRIQQVTSGHLPVVDADGEVTVTEVGTEKRDLLQDYLTDIPAGEPVVVFCRFRHDLANIKLVAEKLGRTYGELSGTTKTALTDDATLRPGLDVVGVQINSGGVGIDLTAARYGVYYSVGFSLTDYLQSRARLHRPGQERSVLYTHLLTEDTIDATVYQALAAREDVVEAVLAAAKNPEAASA
jgi:SNF2 family DNA or RNA helicase